ncbi:thioesterase II family protein [Coleofasciculus sp. FACHB-T130]|uniref:thioesterase II family protein n=1 Tax=Cyanophyceae TaxID=3028117 RepID=UPI0016898810|nr:thioesterase II family protein [Coleofasciculus sp. FACHB-T130]MBD1879521.1 thioesterase [Coleofasciculus sp. FACHB-T130]
MYCPKPNPLSSLRLFCFPYAGGGALNFRTWSQGLPVGVEVCAVELPGRGKRILEAPFTQALPLVQAIAHALLPYLDKPFAFFGHSMGALVSFEVARLLRRKYGISPVHLFVSGRSAPQLPAKEPPIHALPEPAFIEELRRLNGTPEAVLENVELMELLLPILRADFAVLETYVYAAEPPLQCPITAFGGLQDVKVSVERLEAWQQQTSAKFSLQMLPGDHFFVQSAQPLLLQFLSRELNLISTVGK